jgi:hypothetical protein
MEVIPHDTDLVIARHIRRHEQQAELARNSDNPGHRVGIEEMPFRPRPASYESYDWRASCSCGWGPKRRYYNETEAWAACGRHLMKLEREKA